MTTQSVKIPYDIGRFSYSWRWLVGLLLLILGVGIYAYSQQLIHGEVVTGMRDIGTMGGAAWGVYIAFVVYFVGLSFAGITLAALIRLLKLNDLKPVARIAEVMTIIALVLGALTIVADVGQPGRALLNLFKYARPGSPFFGTFTLVVSGYLLGSLVFFYLDCRRDAYLMAQRPGRLQNFYRRWAAGYQDTVAERDRHQRTTFWLAIALVPLLIVATSTLGFVFGLQVGRPGWFGSLQAPAFVALAGVSGVGMLIMITALLRRSLNLQQLTPEIFKWLSNILMVLIGVYLYFLAVEWLTTIYHANAQEREITQALVRGPYAGLFWSALALFVVSFAVLIWQYVSKRFSVGWMVLSGLLVNIAAVFKRYLIVVPSQTHGALLPYAPGSYTPTLVEYGVILGLFALGALLFVLFIKTFPILELPESPANGGAAAPPRDTARKTWAVSLVLAGFAVQIIAYFLLAAPLGTPTSYLYADPRVPYAPVIFILGVALVFVAAVVYEVMPERKPAT